jgi:hypothetical protein
MQVDKGVTLKSKDVPIGSACEKTTCMDKYSIATAIKKNIYCWLEPPEKIQTTNPQENCCLECPIEKTTQQEQNVCLTTRYAILAGHFCGCSVPSVSIYEYIDRYFINNCSLCLFF